MSDESLHKVYVIGGIALAIFIIFLWPHTYNWDGDGEINLYPDSESVKNYRLPATIEVTHKQYGWFSDRTTYQITNAGWPNEGSLKFDSCSVKKDSTSSCTDTSGESWTVEVNSAPEQPEEDYEVVDY